MTFQSQSLAQLKVDCQQQIDQYRQESAARNESLSCLEIVRRASLNIPDALGILLEITQSLVYTKCPLELREHRDDIMQEVSLRLIRKFRHKTSLFKVSTFSAYRRFVNLTIQSVASNIQDSENVFISADELQETRGLESTIPDTSEQLVQQEQVRLALDLLTNPLEREAFWRRHGLGEKPDEIVDVLLLVDSEMTKQKVYRLVERALNRIQQDPRLKNIQ